MEEEENKIMESRIKAAPWITRQIWEGVEKLSQIPPFNQPNEENEFPNLIEHIQANADSWKLYLHEDTKSSTTGVVEEVNLERTASENGSVDDGEEKLDKAKKEKNPVKEVHFIEKKTKMTTIKIYQSGMPGNYEAYHKIS